MYVRYSFGTKWDIENYKSLWQAMSQHSVNIDIRIMRKVIYKNCKIGIFETHLSQNYRRFTISYALVSWAMPYMFFEQGSPLMLFKC